MTYTITIETNTKIEPGNRTHWEVLLANPANHYFISKIEST